MDIGLERLEALLVGHAEMLLLVDDDEAEILEGHVLGEQRMGADHDVDGPGGEARAVLLHLGGGDEARELRHLHRQPFEALGEGPVMLARQQGGGHHHRHLLAAHGPREGGAQRHLGLAEADIAADEAVHGTTGIEIGQDGVDGGGLVLGLLECEAGGELAVEAVRSLEAGRLAHEALGRDLDELAGHLQDALLHLGLAGLPGTAAETIEGNLRIFRAVAGQKLDILHRQQQQSAGILDLQAIVRRARRRHRLEADEPADAVIGMDHEIAGLQRLHLQDDVLWGVSTCASGAPAGRRGCRLPR